jgi:uncharacterized protein YggU (UPF0235/DUF167 family)
VGVRGDALKVRLTAPPVEGMASEAVAALLAEVLGVRTRRVRIVSGDTARTAVVEADGVATEAVWRRSRCGVALVATVVARARATGDSRPRDAPPEQRIW